MYSFTAVISGHHLWTLESGVSRLREHPKGPEALSARRATVEAEVIAEVPFATPTMQAVQDSWMGLVTRRASGVWVFLGDTIWVLGFVIVV